MNNQEIAKVTNLLCAAYNRDVTPELLNLMRADYSGWEYEEFTRAAQQHRRDPDRGRFFPTLADMLAKRHGTADQIKVAAGIEFDENPCIDGTGSFDAQRETIRDRQMRRQRFVAMRVDQYQRQLREGGGMLPGGETSARLEIRDG